MNRWKQLVAGAFCAILTTGWLYADDNSPGRSAKKQGAEERQTDRDAIRSTVKGFGAAFMQGEGEKAGTFLTEGAELMPDGGPALRGRKAIQEAITKHFAKTGKQTVSLDVESLRFLSKDTAIEEGHIKSAVQNQAPTSQRYSMLHVREDGKWLIGGIREWPSESAGIRELEWLVGTWSAKRNDVEFQATYEWLGNKAFLRGNITLRRKDRTVSAMQVLGVDPQTGELNIWIFEADGGFAEGKCTREKDTWVFETSGVSGKGKDVSTKNILLRVNQDTMTWQPVNLLVDGEQMMDLPPVKVTRVK
jgi:uncharacterized protein (TIGR02246 family)